MDEVRNFFVGVRFGLQPNTSASSRSGTEVKQDWFTVGFCFSQSGIGFFDPLHRHYVLHIPVILYFVRTMLREFAASRGQKKSGVSGRPEF